MRRAISVVEYEHPDHGVVRVFYRWESSSLGGLVYAPFGVEFGLFTPDSEVDLLTEELTRVRLDMSISVSAIDPYTEEL